MLCDAFLEESLRSEDAAALKAFSAACAAYGEGRADARAGLLYDSLVRQLQIDERNARRVTRTAAAAGFGAADGAMDSPIASEMVNRGFTGSSVNRQQSMIARRKSRTGEHPGAQSRAFKKSRESV